MYSHYMPKEEKCKLALRIIELRDKYNLTFGVIGERLGIHESQAHTTYRRTKKKERGE